MGNKIDLLKEIYTRLNTAIGTGKALVDVKRVQIGAREEARKSNDLPIINIRPTGGEEIARGQYHCKVDNMEIEIALICNRLDSENSLYTATSTGPLRYFELLLNTLDKNTSDAIDLTFNDEGNNLPLYDYEINYLDGLVEFVLTIELETAQFRTGSR